MKISVVIPVFNEVDTIEEILSRVSNVPIEKEIIVIDDCSVDGTRERLKKMVDDKENLKLFYHKHNKGKGAALRTGFASVTGDVVIIQDADLEYDPNDYPKLLEPILDGRADAVFGSRFIGGPHRVLFFWHYVGNKLLTLLSNALTNLNLTDMETCYKVFNRQVLNEIDLKSNRFGFEPEFTAKVAKKRFRIYGVAGLDDIGAQADGAIYVQPDGSRLLAPSGNDLYSIFYNVAEGTGPGGELTLLRDVKQLRFRVFRRSAGGNSVNNIYNKDYYRARWPESE